MTDFAGRVAIVTGGASGIGRNIAQALAEKGARVMIADIDKSGADAAALSLRDSGATAISIGVDVRSAASVSSAFEDTIAHLGRLDILVHSAGIGVERQFLETGLEEWRHIIDVDLTGTFLCCQAAASEMVKSRYGRIVTLASTAGIRGGVGRAAYGAAKGGVITLTKVIAVELSRFGITANALAPGAIETELVARMHSHETRRNYTRAIPMGRYGTVEDVSSAALFLASEEARYVTGQVFAVDGGFLAAGVMNA